VVQSVGDLVAPIVYHSKQLDPSYRGWSACLKVLATAALLIPEAQKIIFNLHMTVRLSHNIQNLAIHKALNSISPTCVKILHCFPLQHDLTFKQCQR
jgi:hypothetical protein